MEAILEVSYHVTHYLANIFGSVVPGLVNEGPVGPKYTQESEELSKSDNYSKCLKRKLEILAMNIGVPKTRLILLF